MSRLAVIKKFFGQFYSQNKFLPPRLMEMREFGFLAFDQKIMLRHKSFEGIDNLRSFITRMVPAHVYYSAAYYKHPTEEMERKVWEGADLIFDIDADHIPTKCKEEHEYWECDECGKWGRGKSPGVCACGGKMRGMTWFCDQCLGAAKSEVIKLLGVLSDDFGLSPNDLKVFFSGHRGYHIHVGQEDIRQLDQLQRKEITDYVTATGLRTNWIILGNDVEGRDVVGPSVKEPGWRGGLAKAIYGFLISATKEEMREAGLKGGVIRALLDYREHMMEGSSKEVPWSIIKGVGLKSWRKIADFVLEGRRIMVDTVVTTDIHRLIRMPTTLHGKTGLRVTPVPVTQIDDFDPLSEAVAFEGHLRVHVKFSPRFRVGEQELGPYRDCEVDLPLAAALLLLCKNLAEVA